MPQKGWFNSMASMEVVALAASMPVEEAEAELRQPC